MLFAAVSAAKIFRLFAQVLRNYLLSKNISVSKSIIWLSHQVPIHFQSLPFIHFFRHLLEGKTNFPISFLAIFCFWKDELMWNLFGLKEVLCEDFWNVTLCFLINFTFVRRRCILRNILWILKMHSCQRCDLWPTKVWCQHHQGQSGLSFIIQFPMLWRHFFNYIFHFQNGRFQK